jgi:hypothetical protein
LAWRFKRVRQLVEIVCKHMERTHRTSQWRSHQGLGIFRILMFTKLSIALIAPLQNDVPILQRFGRFSVEPILP